MVDDVRQDQFVLIKVEGMHCHKCQQTIQRALHDCPGVHEAEVDFNSKQASVLYDPASISVRDLMSTINEAGYHATGFSQSQRPA